MIIFITNSTTCCRNIPDSVDILISKTPGSTSRRTHSQNNSAMSCAIWLICMIKHSFFSLSPQKFPNWKTRHISLIVSSPPPVFSCAAWWTTTSLGNFASPLSPRSARVCWQRWDRWLALASCKRSVRSRWARETEHYCRPRPRNSRPLRGAAAARRCRRGRA